MRVQKNQFFLGLGLTRAGKGYPDITLLEPIADALSVSVTELISGNTVYNSNHYISFIAAVSSDRMQMVKLYPINLVKGIDDRENSHDNTEERRELEKAAKMLFG